MKRLLHQFQLIFNYICSQNIDFFGFILINYFVMIIAMPIIIWDRFRKKGPIACFFQDFIFF